MEVVEIVNNF